MRKNMDHLKDQGIDQSGVEKNEAHKAHDYERKYMESTHNKISRGSECICKSRSTAHKDEWRGGRKHAENVGRVGYGRQEKKK